MYRYHFFPSIIWVPLIALMAGVLLVGIHNYWKIKTSSLSIDEKSQCFGGLVFLQGAYFIWMKKRLASVACAVHELKDVFFDFLKRRAFLGRPLG